MLILKASSYYRTLRPQFQLFVMRFMKIKLSAIINVWRLHPKKFPVICSEVKKYLKKIHPQIPVSSPAREGKSSDPSQQRRCLPGTRCWGITSSSSIIKKNKQNLETLLNQQVECWSDRSKPAADLQFFINGDRVSINSPLFE